MPAVERHHTWWGRTRFDRLRARNKSDAFPRSVNKEPAATQRRDNLVVVILRHGTHRHSQLTHNKQKYRQEAVTGSATGIQRAHSKSHRLQFTPVRKP